MPDKKRFEEFVAKITEDGDWEYDDGTSMTEDAKVFLKWYQQLNELWVTLKRVYSEEEG